MNVVKGGIDRSKNVGNRSMFTTTFRGQKPGFLPPCKMTCEINKSARGSNVQCSSSDGNTSDTACTSDDSMRPPFAPLQSSNNKRNVSSIASLDKSVICDESGDTQHNRSPGGLLDLSQPRIMWTPKYREPESRQFTSSTSRGQSGSRSRTPGSSTSSTTMPESCVVLALSEGRGAARGEVGLAAIDLRRPSLTLCQLSDNHSYLHTLTTLLFFNPVEIIVANTFCDTVPIELYRVVRQNFPNVLVTPIQRRHFSDAQGLQYIKNLCAPEYASVQLQLMHKFYALTCAGAIVKYVEYIQCVVFQPHSLKIEYHCSQNSTWIDVETAIRLELVESLSSSRERGVSLLSILDQTRTAGGVRALRVTILQPPSNLSKIRDRADAVQELIDNNEGLMPGLQNVMKQLYDVDKILWLCMELPSPQGGSKAGEAQLNHTILLKNTMDLVPALVAALELAKGKWFSTVRKDLGNPKFVEITERIKRVIHDGVYVVQGRAAQQQRCFAVKPEINGLLDVARRSYSELVSDIQERVEVLSTMFNLPLKLCNSATRGFHIGLPVGPRNKRTFKVEDLPPVFIEVQNHGASVTMTTEEVVLLDQQAKEALSEIQTMSNIVIFGLLTDLRPYMSVLYKLCEHVAELDVILSLAQVSIAGDYVRPAFAEYLELKDSIHPLLDNVLPVPTVPNDVFASPEFNFHIITGPNMGGKTIYIKQIALLQIMAQIGCFVPATSATFRICDRIFTRIGFNDSIECNASTYILEMKEIQHILQTITPRSLIIIDELCRGTSSEEGTSMSWAICERLLNTSAFTFFTTHFLYLTKLQDVYFNVVNLHLVAEEIVNPTNDQIRKLAYKHKVKPGVTTLERYGLTLARHTNLPDTVISLAHELAEIISAKKKPIPPSDRKCMDDVILYKLGADLLQELRKPNASDDKLRDIFKEFNENHSDLVKTLNSNKVESANDSTNTIPESVHSRKTMSQEDPILPFETLNAIRKQYNKGNNNVNLSQASQMEDGQVLFNVSRNSTKTSTPVESVQVTPKMGIPNQHRHNVVIISESDNTTSYSDMDITDGYVDHRFENPNKRNISMISQPSTSKGVNINYFVAPFGTPESFKENDAEMKRTIVSPTSLNDSIDSTISSPSYEKLIASDRNALANDFETNNIINAVSDECFKLQSRASDKITSVDNKTNATSLNIVESPMMHQSSNVEKGDDNLMMKMVGIFGSEQQFEMHNLMLAYQNPANTENLEELLKAEESEGISDMDIDSDEVGEIKYCSQTSFQK